ncbi:MAG: SDR family oxidoreductase [Pseudomonadota bacterium]
MKRVLITGGGKRLGAIIAQHVHENGWVPILHYGTSKNDAHRLAQKLSITTLQADLSDPDAVTPLIKKSSQMAGGPLTALINCASIFEHDRPETTSQKALAKHYQINTIAPILLSQAFAAQATGVQDPVIVNILDQKLHNLHPDHFSYTLSKAALETATHMMAQSFAPLVRAVGVAPGYTLPAPGETEEAFAGKAAGANPLRRRLDPKHIAQAVQFCLDCPAITGQTILADNGEHLVPTMRDISFQTDLT